MQQLMQDIVESMLMQYEEYGATQSSLNTYRNGYCQPIIRYCSEHNDGYYSDEILDSFLKTFEERLNNKDIGINYYTTYARVVKILKSVATTGTADFSREPSAKQFIPSDEHLKATNTIILINKVSTGSVKGLHAQIRHIFCFIEEHGVSDSDVSDDIFFEYIESAAPANKGNMGVLMRAVRLTSRYMKENGSSKLVTDFSLLPYKKGTVHMVPPYSQDELKRIVDVIDISTPIGKRDFAIMLLAYDTGLRGIDIILLQLADINWQAGTLAIRQKKTNEPITQPLKGVVLNALADYILDGRPDNGQHEVFLSSVAPYHAFKGSFSLDAIIEKYCRIAGVEKKSKRSFHSVRRAFATELSLKGVQITEISEMLGHRKVRSCKSYLSYNRSQISIVAADFSEIPLSNGIYAAKMKFLKEEQQ